MVSKGVPTELRGKAALSDYLAAERTVLAWIRTGLALMGFGFVVARFGLFLQELRTDQHSLAAPSYELSLWFGTALIAAGVVVNVLSGWHHARVVRELDRGETANARPAMQVVALALFLALVGLAMTIYLAWVRGPAGSGFTGSEVRSMTLSSHGIVDTPSNHSVDQTVEGLKEILQTKGVTVFELVDHSGEGGVKMPPTKLLIFGSPKAGTPLMLPTPSS
jgi:putative membrane protein